MRPTTTRPPLPMSLLAILASAAVACSTPGNPVSSEQTPTPATSNSTSTTPSRSETNTSPLRDTDPCTLLPASVASSLGFGQGKTRDISQSRGCRWVTSGSHTTDVAIYDNLGLKDASQNGTRQELPPIGKHQAVQLLGVAGDTCTIIFKITESSMVTVVTTAGANKDKACQISQQVAQRVEPQLP